MPGVDASALQGRDQDLSTVLPTVDASAVRGLKFGEILPPHLATATLAERLVDLPAARRVLSEPRRPAS